jgi:beta-galactosidase
LSGRDRNHPSIVLWSAGNEIGEQTMADGAGVLKRLLDIFHREDPTRPVTTGNDNIAADGHPATQAFLNALDIVGYNYVDRWHERRELFAAADRHDHPEWKMIGTESGSIFQSFDERYSLGADPKVARPNYTSGMIQAERLWKWVELNDYFAGNFMWTGVDYLGESTWPFKGFPSGVLDIIGHPKDSYYLYQSLWTERPVLHLFPALELDREGRAGDPGARLHQLQQRGALSQRPLIGREAARVPGPGNLRRLEQLRAAARQRHDRRPAPELGRPLRAG